MISGIPNLLNIIHEGYLRVLQYIATFLTNYFGLTQTQAEELSPIVLLFLAITITYLTSHMFTAFRKYVQAAIVLFAVIILIAIVVR